MFAGNFPNEETFLRHFQDRVEVFRVFEKFFPREFAKLGITPVSPLADRNQAYVLLKDLLEKKMPLHFNEMDELAEDGDEGVEDEFIRCIPIAPQGFDYDEANPRYFSFSTRVLLTICADYDDDVIKALVKKQIPHEQIEIDQLQQLCEQQKGALRYLSVAYGAVFNCTGNLWLDISSELYWNSEPCEWSIAAVSNLIDAWEEADQLCKLINKFEEWLAQDLRNIRKVEALLQQAARGNRVRVTTNGRPLIETLPDFEEVLDED